MKLTWIVTPDDEGIRPAGPPDECLYCHQKVGQEHKFECVIRERTVEIEITIRLPRRMPESWSKEDIEFYMNMGSWCWDNILDELAEFANKNGCLCHCSKATVVSVCQ